MENHNYGYPGSHPSYPPPSFRPPPGSFSGPNYPPEVQQAPHHSLSGNLHYPPPPPPSHPSYAQPYPPSYPSYPIQSPDPAGQPQPYPPPATAPSYPPFGVNRPESSVQHYGSFHYNSFGHHSEGLQYPPPHSDSLHAPATHTCNDPYGAGASSQMPQSAHSLGGMFEKVQISGSKPSHSNSGKFSQPMPYSPPTSSFNGSHHGSQNSSFSGSQHGQQILPSKQPSSKVSSLKLLLLHGNLDLWVFEAKNLPNMDKFSSAIGDILGPKLTAAVSGKLDSNTSASITSDPYVTFSASHAVLGRTFVISNNENPVWNQHFYVPVAHHVAEITFRVKDSDEVGSELIGTVAIPVAQIYTGDRVEGTYSVLGSNGKPCKAGATLKLAIQYIPIERLTMYHIGVGAGPDYNGVPGTYFPLRRGMKVKLYQDAHVPDGCLPQVRMEHGIPREHGKCWQDICEAISQARRLIYITGWSVYHKVQLVRDAVGRSGSTLGDLLKLKSQEGVRILLLIWDDPTSKSILGYQKDGVMQTHDEETRRFFKHSSVHVLLCPRSAAKRHSWLKQQEIGFIYTHHQKTVIVDADAGNNKRKIVSFVGGLDLCDGRYDTPQHSLFKTLQTLHKDDYHNPTFTGPNIGGPREPWHDLHSRLDGPAAYDVLKNFEERWSKASKPHGMQKFKSQEDKLLTIERIQDILRMDESSNNDNDPDTWHVQIFRSIDSSSVKGFPEEDPRQASSKNLVCGKNILIDMSIHTAYVKAIRAAQHFIYIENQYFLGSSYNWNAHKDLGANNLIPMEIALKIVSKIKANERFSVYIVIPMWPEGVPTGVPTQRILYWQNKTMQMMYETIHKALVEVGLQNVYTPQDYLNFFCLGNREALDSRNPPSGSSTNANCPDASAMKNRRFMIYVHSKGMIVDDEYIIVGSANINQRSLEGTRDTEIAMGAYQPQHTWAKKQSGPRGQIYAYRMSLWAEHIGGIEECFNHPESLECMRRVRVLGESNWNQFTANEVTEMKGHLIKYPVDVDASGAVKPLRGFETFPDVGGSICGSFIAVQENLTI